MSVLNIPHLLLGVEVFIEFDSIRYFEFIIFFNFGIVLAELSLSQHKHHTVKQKSFFKHCIIVSRHVNESLVQKIVNLLYLNAFVISPILHRE